MCCNGEETLLFHQGREAVLINLLDKLHVFLPPHRVMTVGVTQLMLLVVFLTIMSVVLGVRNVGYQPRYRASGWTLFFQVFLHSNTMTSPTVAFFAPGIPIPAASLSRAQSEGQSLQHGAVLLQQVPQIVIGRGPSTLVTLTSAENKTQAALGKAGCPTWQLCTLQKPQKALKCLLREFLLC